MMRDDSDLARALVSAALALVLILAASGCKGDQGVGRGGEATADEIWKTTCSSCHGLEGGGTDRLGRRLSMQDPAWQRGISDAQIRDTIRYGKKGMRATMRAYGSELTEAQIEALVERVRAFGP